VAGKISHTEVSKDIRLEELQPWGWRIAVTSPAAQFEVRSLIAGRIRAFHDIYERGGRLIGVGRTTSGEGFLVWDLNSQCQVTGAMGFGIKKSPDGRFVFFQQFVARGENPTGSVYRVVDIDAGSCPVAPPVEESLRSIVVVGDAILPLPPQDSAMASTLEGRSPMEWIGDALVFVTRNSATNIIELHRYNPHSKRVSSRTLDWRPLASSKDLTHLPHPSAAFSFKSVKAVGGEDGLGIVRLQLVDDYLHAAKWVDMPLPPAR
jgi:hypothetical protein